MALPLTFRRLIAFVGSSVLLPEAILFLGLSIWKGLRFYNGLIDPGPPRWYYFSSALFLLTASFFCVSTCRELWSKARVEEKVEDELSTEKSGTPTAAQRLTMLWLSAAFTVSMFVIPLLLITLGALLDKREEVGWLIGVPVGLGVIIFFTLLRLRKRGKGK
ncbi:MAG: hypothetical protein P1U68_03290 [Verrucomicrobiales bacterium]|nr:hypothetical protein [Verrucomicrobiales bacterium]